MNSRDTEHVFEALRKGLVPERGVDTFAVGIAVFVLYLTFQG